MHATRSTAAHYLSIFDNNQKYYINWSASVHSLHTHTCRYAVHATQGAPGLRFCSLIVINLRSNNKQAIKTNYHGHCISERIASDGYN